MTANNQYKVMPVKIDDTAKYSTSPSIFGKDTDFIFIAIIVEVIAIIVAIYSGGGTFWILGLFVIVGYFIITKMLNDTNDAKHTKRVIAGQINNAEKEAEFYSQKFNSILERSQQIVSQMLPYFETSTKQCLEKARIDFSENAYSPFWSEIEKATGFLACYTEALNQLCLNSEVYKYTLKRLKHNFPMPFPFAIDISISQTIVEGYKSIIRQAHTNPTFSIIWEQRRNSQILIGGFRTLEGAVNNMSSNISSAICDLKNSISSELNEMKFIQQEQLQNFESSQIYLNQTLSSMDNKLYYIQWREKPLGTFHHR
jgi:hypothetical protein